MIVHPEYNSNTPAQVADLAVMKLDQGETWEPFSFITLFEQNQQMTLLFIQYHNLGINFAELQEISKSLVSIFGWYSIAKDLFVQWTQTQTTQESSPEDDLENETENVPYGNLIESLANISSNMDDNKAEKKP